MWIESAFGLGLGGSSTTWVLSSAPPSCSVGSAFPYGENSTLMNPNSNRARCGLYGVVDSLAFFKCSRTAFRKCHQHSCIFTNHASRSIPISAMSLSVCANMGITPYVFRKHFIHSFKAFFRFPMSIAFAVDNRQYDSGKPALSCSPNTL